MHCISLIIALLQALTQVGSTSASMTAMAHAWLLLVPANLPACTQQGCWG